MEEPAAARALNVPELRERILPFAVRKTQWTFNESTLRACRLVTRAWRDTVNKHIVTDIWFSQSGNTTCWRSKFDIRSLLEQQPELVYSVRLAAFSRHEGKDLTVYEMGIAKAAAGNLRELKVTDLSDLAACHVETGICFPNLAKIHFEPRFEPGSPQIRAFLASLPSLHELSMFFGYEDEPLPWFKLDELLQGVAHRLTSLGLYASFVRLTAPDLQALFAMIPRLRKLHMVTDEYDDCEDLGQALPDSLYHLSGILGPLALISVLERLADPKAMPLLQSVPDIAGQPEADAKIDDPPVATMPRALVEDAIQGLFERKDVNDVEENDWLLWQLVDTDPSERSWQQGHSDGGSGSEDGDEPGHNHVDPGSEASDDGSPNHGNEGSDQHRNEDLDGEAGQPGHVDEAE